MPEPVQLNSPKFPKIVSELIYSGQILKFLSAFSLVLAIGSLICLGIAVSRPATVLTLGESGEVIEKLDKIEPEAVVKTAVHHYLKLRYQWGPEDIKQNLTAAQAFILPGNMKAYETASANLVNFSIERLVFQRIFPERIDVNLEQGTVSIIGDRITSIQGLKAVGDVKLELSFQSGDHTKENPWGIYIIKEREE